MTVWNTREIRMRNQVCHTSCQFTCQSLLQCSRQLSNFPPYLVNIKRFSNSLVVEKISQFLKCRKGQNHLSCLFPQNVLDKLSGWPQHRANREFGYQFSRQGIKVQHREFNKNTGIAIDIGYTTTVQQIDELVLCTMCEKWSSV